MKNLLRILFIAIFMIFVANVYAVQPATNSLKPKVVKVQIQEGPVASIVAPLHKTDSGKSQLIAALLAFFLGSLGIHNFYLGYKKKGMTQLLLTLGGYALYVVGIILGYATGGLGLIISGLASLVLLAVWIWALIDFIKILSGDLKPADGEYSETL